jgi:uncharacterized OsmC-like protein
VLKRVHAHYTLQAEDDVDREKLDRVMSFHADHCPVARSIRDAIAITTSIDVVPLDG